MKFTTRNGILVCLSFLFMTSCRKADPTIELLQGEANARLFDPPGCRLTAYDYNDPIHELHATDYFTYKNGLVDEWQVGYGWIFKMKYNRQHKLVASDAYADGILVSKIYFTYKNNKVIKENWLDPVTNELGDDVRYTYNWRGQMTQGESLVTGYTTKYVYNADGSMRSWQIFLDGKPNQKADYTYYAPYRNPYLSVDGIDYSFPYVNANFGAGLGARWYSSEKLTFYEEDGMPYTYYEQQPGKTKWETGDQFYPVAADYTDKLTGQHITNGFQYENCKSCWFPFSKNSRQSGAAVLKNMKTINRLRIRFSSLRTAQ